MVGQAEHLRFRRDKRSIFFIFRFPDKQIVSGNKGDSSTLVSFTLHRHEPRMKMMWLDTVVS